MDELLARFFDLLVGRATGPLHLRLVIQPMMAAFLAIRAGARDARDGRTPFGFAVLVGRGHRADLMREAWSDVATLFLAALVIDALYQIIEFHWVYLVQSLVVAALISFPTYLVLRGPTTRVLRRWSPTRRSSSDSKS
jgi:hypothetical protein